MTLLQQYQEWQSKVDSYFPDGVNIMGVIDVPEAPEENTIFLASRLFVIDIHGADMPTFRASPIGWQKDLICEVAEILEDRQGYLHVLDLSDSQWVFTDNIQPGAKARVEQDRSDNPEYMAPVEWDLPAEEPAA